LTVCVAVLTACNRAAPTKQYQLTGQILDVKPDTKEVLVRHEDIPGFMPAMTMPYKVEDAKLLADKQAGDLITATLVVGETTAAPVEDRQDRSRAGRGCEWSWNHRFADPQSGRTGTRYEAGGREQRAAAAHFAEGTPSGAHIHVHDLSAPDFCPLMDRNFASVQNEIKKTPALADVRLVSVSFDPAHDTPAVLKTHAQALQADPAVWHFVTASADDIKGFAAQFGVIAEPSEESPAILTHNLSTAVIDADGRLVTIRPGNMWTPADLIADLKAAPAPAH
jgi:protein SCO1/2